MVDLAIIIVSYKTKALLDKCLESVFRDDVKFSFEVILVDNVSDDGTVEMAREKYPLVKVIANDKNVGFSAGNNIGVRNSESRNILLLNPDTEVNGPALEKLVDFLDRHEHVGIVGPRLLNTDGTLQDSWFRFPMLFGGLFGEFRSRAAMALLGIKENHPEIEEAGVKRVDVIKGACLMIKRKAMEEAGLMDENSFLYAEDTDLCIKTWKNAWDVYALYEQTIVHHGHASTDQKPYITIVSSRRSAVYLHKKHYARPIAFLWNSLVYLEVFYKYFLFRSRASKSGNNVRVQESFRAYNDLVKEVFGKRRQ